MVSAAGHRARRRMPLAAAPLAVALLILLAGPVPPAAGDTLDARRLPAARAVVAFLPERDAGRSQPRSDPGLLADLERRPALAVGLASPTVGDYSRRQALLDIGQGARISARAYPEPLGPLALRRTGAGGRVVGWAQAARRAAAAPARLEPGLLAETVAAGAGPVAYAGVAGEEQLEAVAAADRRGAIARVSLGPAADLPARVGALRREAPLVVARLAEGRDGLRALDRLLADRRGGDLVIVVGGPPVGSLALLPIGVAADGLSGTVRSDTTRRVGLVAATDIAPTVLERLGLAVPGAVQGRPLEAEPDAVPGTAARLGERLEAVPDRRGPAVLALLAAWLALLAALAAARGRRGARTALRLALLAVLWLPGLMLLGAALAPSAIVEIVLLAAGPLALAAVTDRLVPWPAGPAAPAAATFAAHALDLAAGSPLIAASLAGPNPRGGARFYGVGNELETLLSLGVILGAGAALSRAAPSRAPRAFVAVGVLAAVVLGAGRLGADVGAVVTLGAGVAAAVVASVAPERRRRAMVLGVVAPVVAVAGLVAVDVVTAGGAHLSRTVVEAEGPGEVVEVVVRRVGLSVAALVRGVTPVAVALAFVLLAAGLIRRRALLAPLARAPGVRAGIAGAFAATLVGALANDSGPDILLIGTTLLLLSVGYVQGRPGARGVD